jgi:hypothetical protein
MSVFNFFKNASENRTQFFLVMGFIVLPLFGMVYVFFDMVILDQTKTSQRMKMPQPVIEAQESKMLQSEAESPFR